MRRRFFNFCSGLSLPLCLAICVLWIRSYWRMDQVNWLRPGCLASIATSQGYVRAASLPVDYSHRPDFWYEWGHNEYFDSFTFDHDLERQRLEPGDKHIVWQHGRIEWYSMRDVRTGKLYFEIIFPFWAMAAFTAVLPFWRMMMRWSHSRRSKRIGHCVSCGYDLRATPDRCPECGMIPAKSEPVSS
jgi:hypothetical protein